MEERMLTMRVEGEAITQIAREQCYYSRKFDSAMNILIASLQNEELEEGEIAGIALSILDGRAEIKGTYPDGDYRLEYLEAQDEKWKLGNLIDKIARELEQQKKDKQTLLKKYLFVLDSLEEWEKRSLNDEYFEEWNERLFEDIPARAETQERGGLLESFLKRMSDKEEHTTEDYGWLEPNGTFHGVEWGEHSKWADDWLRDNLTEEEYEETDCKYRLYNSGDALVDRGWILLHNPSQGIAYPTESENHVRTKQQKEFLYDYYMERKCYSEANEIWKEGESHDRQNHSSRSSRSVARITAIRQNRNARTRSSDRNCAENVFKMDVQHHGRKAGGICGRRSGRRNREDPRGRDNSMKLEEMIAVIQNPDRVRIFKDKERLFMGFRAALIGGFGKIDEVMIEHGKDEVKSFRECPEITHKKWKEKGLIPPVQPEEMAQYSFSDLQMSLYYDFYI